MAFPGGRAMGIRRSFGRYLLGGMIWDEALWEDYLEWQLISWK